MGEGTPNAHLVAVNAAIVALMRHLEPSNLQISAQHFLRVIVAYPCEVVRFKGMAQVGRGWSNATKEGIFLHPYGDADSYGLEPYVGASRSRVA